MTDTVRVLGAADLLAEIVAASRVGYGDPVTRSNYPASLFHRAVALLAVSPQGEGSSADAAPIKPSVDTGELRKRVAKLICRAAGHNPDGPTYDIYIHDDPDAGSPWAGYRKDADAILDLIQSKRAG